MYVLRAQETRNFVTFLSDDPGEYKIYLTSCSLGVAGIATVQYLCFSQSFLGPVRRSRYRPGCRRLPWSIERVNTLSLAFNVKY